MKPTQTLLTIVGILGSMVLVGCNIGLKGPPSIVQQAAATLVALTMQATSASEPANTPFASPAAGTPSSTAATLTINNPTNCRGGPGPTFQLITAFTPGTTLQLVGKDTAHNYWLVLIPKTQNTCWASGDYATASGNYQTLPEATPASTDLSIPTRPGSFQYSWSCPGGNLSTSITWTDTSNNETGFNVYRNGVLVVSLPANTTSYTDATIVPMGSTVSYGITAFNQNGESSPRSFSFDCHP